MSEAWEIFKAWLLSVEWMSVFQIYLGLRFLDLVNVIEKRWG